MPRNGPGTSRRVGRRGFVGGVASLLAAASFSRDVDAGTAARVDGGDAEERVEVTSPDGSLQVVVDVADGVPSYGIAFDGTTLVEPSTIGFEFRGQPTFGAGSDTPLEVTGSRRGFGVERWNPVWDQYDFVSEEYTYLRVGLEEAGEPGRYGTLEVVVFDDGVGFRFVFDGSFGDGDGRFAIAAENTRFDFAGNYTSWWIENEFVNPRFEQEYRETQLSAIPGGTERRHPNGNEIHRGVHTPFTMRTDGGNYLSVHEADLTDYATMSLAPVDDADGSEFVSELAPLPDGTKVAAEAPHVTPWRTVQVGRRPGDLVESSMIPLLNDDLDEAVLPEADGRPDTSWITPGKFVGIWWLMIAGSANWEYRTDEEIENVNDDPRQYIHGAQTERTKRYLAFASEHDIRSVLVEGWNEGWWSYPGAGDAFDFDRSYPDFDLAEVTDYGQSLDPPAEMTAHNETGGNVVNYERQILDDDVFAFYEDNDIHSIKNGYVADMGLGFEDDGVEATHNHHCQLAVNHHELVAREAAANRQLLEIHEGVKPTGRRRTYPNLTTREVIKGQEYDGFDELGSSISPEHHVTIPFTRYLAGPADFTPGIFDIDFTDDNPGRVNTTRAKQLAMYPTYFSGLQMVADRLEAYLDPGLSVGECLQAQAGEIDGFVTADEWRNAYGAHYVAVDASRVPPGSRIAWEVRGVEEAGEYDLHLRYASSGTDNADEVLADGTRATLLVDGEPHDGESGRISPPFTDDWDQWETVTVTVQLEAGDDTVALERREGDRGGFNLDTVAVTAVGEPFPSIPEDENFEAEPEFDFVERVPAAFDDTEVVDARIGEYVVTARRKDREWFLGAMTGGDARNVEVPLEFLSPLRNADDRGFFSGFVPEWPEYLAEIYSDGIGADDDPEDVRIDRAIVDPSTTIQASMVESGGTAIRLRRAREDERRDLPTYEIPPAPEVTIRTEPFVGQPVAVLTSTNDTEFPGGTRLELVVDGEVVHSENARFGPGTAGETRELDYSFGATGLHEVSVRRTDGTVVASERVSVSPPQTVAELSDPVGDDAGPGGYTYPSAPEFRDGAFDLESVSVRQSRDVVRFVFEVAELYRAFGGRNGFSPHAFICWIRDPARDGGSTVSLEDLGANVEFEDPFHYRLRADGFAEGAVDADGRVLTHGDGTEVVPDVEADVDAGTVVVEVPGAAFDGADVGTLEVIPMVHSEDRGSLRAVEETAGRYTFGGAEQGAVGNAPLITDLVTPEGTDQSGALAYDADSRATLPFVPL